MDAESTEGNPIGKSTCLFEHLPEALPVLRDYEIQQKLLQWNLIDSLHLHRFLVHRRMPIEADEALLSEFFQDKNTRRILPKISAHLGSYNDITDPSKSDKAFSLHFERLRVSVTSMAFFEKLELMGIVARDGSIRGCMDEDFDGCRSEDLLTEMLSNPDSDNRNVFSMEDQQEFIFHLFSALVIGGGALRQADSRVQAYEDVTRALYRALVSVRKTKVDAHNNQDIEITSRVYRVHGASLFEDPSSRFHSCFVILDARKRRLTVWYSPFRASW
ncbi:uncharacterized protein PHALS_03910 [Plasmopara halstedii]|uniref:Cilia- and flagella-associated protein 300 n=1 Tax=Plasmopara halstedii TaxID=4781 RepID=A0A0P1B1J0_PLAHL|nr:uncharacterized protein PHALS_03910 [Plasmopara halstedii]CEG47263.1 hypothetical protein PHALS_03910 [Plasmopara halstedii]|eukprot:XP_024583632.1 hypothetical protein PHALS_03910 [Plasmopara halstedii]